MVIGVHSPEFPFEHNLDNVRRAATEMRVAYPIAVDNDFAIWSALNNQYWPALYIVDAQGRIRHHQFGEGGYEQSERIIQQLLLEAGNSGIGRELATVDAPGLEAPAAWSDLKSPENYVGYDRTENFASSGGALRDRPRVYAVPGRLRLNHWALSGDWTMNKGAVVSNKPNGRIAYRFHARDLHLVMGPATGGGPVRFRVLVDGKAPGPAHGTDVDDQGSERRHPAAVSADPAIRAHRGPDVRDRISRSRRRSVRVHVRMIPDPASWRERRESARRRLAGTSSLIRVVIAGLTSVLLSGCGRYRCCPSGRRRRRCRRATTARSCARSRPRPRTPP